VDPLALFSELLNAGPMAVLAGLSLWMLNRVWQSRLDAEQKNVETERRHSEEIEALYRQSLQVIQANTAAMTKLTERLEKR